MSAATPDSLTPERLALPAIVLAAALSLGWMWRREASVSLPVEEATPEQLERALNPASDLEFTQALASQAQLGPVDVQRALAASAAPSSHTERVDRGLALLLSDPNPKLGLAAMEACIALGPRGQLLSAPLLQQQSPEAARRALIIQAWTLPPTQAEALLREHLSGPLAPLAALELSRLSPGAASETRLSQLLEGAPEQDRVIVEYALRLATDRSYQGLPNTEL